MSSGSPPSRALLIAAGAMTQFIGALCLVLAAASLPVVHDLKTGMSGVIASLIASLAAIICGTLVWRGRLVPLALAAGLNVGFGIGLPRGGSAIGAMLRILPADDVDTAETLIIIAAVFMFMAAVLCVLAVPSALKLRQWARDELARPPGGDDLPAPALEPPPGEEPRRIPRTLPGFGPSKLMPTQVIRLDRQRGKPAVIIGVAVTLIAIGVIVISAATGSDSESPTTAAAPSTSSNAGASTTKLAAEPGGSAAAITAVPIESDAGAPILAEPPPLDEFVIRYHDALASETDLPLVFDTNAFALGVESHDLAEGRDAVVKQLREDLGPPAKVEVKFSHVGQDGDIAWIAEELRTGGKTVVITAIASLRDNAWTIAALHCAVAMPNDTAYRLAREGELGVPDAIPDTHDSSPLAVAMRTAFASKPSFVEARSTRADAFNFGSAPGERLKGGDAIRRIFGRIKATLRLRDAVKVGALGDRGGWGVANVEFTDADKDGTEVTQTFRVLAGWVKEDAGWRIVVTQWSNAR